MQMLARLVCSVAPGRTSWHWCSAPQTKTDSITLRDINRAAVQASVGDFVGASVRFRTVPGPSIPLEVGLLPGSRSRKAIAIKGFNGRSERI
jgi:hypothetical protein